MYLPKHFTVEDRTAIADLIAAHPFATVVSERAGEPFVTHCPLVLRQDGERWTLEGHLAKANPHWSAWAEAPRLLVLFHGPHGYVSPTLYAERLSVPTWNYVAVHCYGSVEAVHDRAAKESLLKRLIAHVEPPYAAQWDELPEDFQGKLLDAIVGFRIEVERCEAKFKLSQNRPAGDRARIKAALAEGGDDAKEMLQWMERLGA